jgi:hypothetical protein
MQVTHLPDQSGLICADCEQGSVRSFGMRFWLYHCDPQRARRVEVILVNLAPHFDLVDTGFVHAVPPFGLTSWPLFYPSVKQRTSHKDVICAEKRM